MATRYRAQARVERLGNLNQRYTKELRLFCMLYANCVKRVNFYSTTCSNTPLT